VPDIPDAFCSHKTSGRMRLKIPSKKGNRGYFTFLTEQLSGISGIEKIEANPLTGSVLFLYTCGTEAIAEHAETNSIFKLNGLNQYPTNLHQRISNTFKGINDRVKGVTGGEMDMGTLAFLVLAGAGIYQISRGNFTAPAWYTAFWYALNIFLKSGANKGAK